MLTIPAMTTSTAPNRNKLPLVSSSLMCRDLLLCELYASPLDDVISLDSVTNSS